MQRLNSKINRLNVIQILQNPVDHIVVKYQSNLSADKVDFRNMDSWIAYENQFSIEYLSGLTGKDLYQLVCLLCILNLQAGVATRFMDKVKNIPRNKILSFYYKYEPIRKTIQNKNVYEVMSIWLYENKYISQLELMRLLGYKQTVQDTPTVDSMNHQLMEKEIPKYVEAYWSKTS